jgi:hypothetical protein
MFHRTNAYYRLTIDFPERDAIIGMAEVQRLEERFLRI